jgi:hypothetical protein
VVHGDLAELTGPEPPARPLRSSDVLASMIRMIHRVDTATASGEGGAG